ncbi:Peptidase S9, prolyl oligopeptidase [Candida maltosa Xu316]|uniref:Peptidase S9, prolyl oligopeptidase n=1 Tax=Candida maltosa (strain Xu316) TaxID=1245528 RepID=M3JZ91_CANMX|nr:Peptidase S9, prolyl oligopeptidase [Candida maltosa Xu316]
MWLTKLLKRLKPHTHTHSKSTPIEEIHDFKKQMQIKTNLSSEEEEEAEACQGRSYSRCRSSSPATERQMESYKRISSIDPLTPDPRITKWRSYDDELTFGNRFRYIDDDNDCVDPLDDGSGNANANGWGYGEQVKRPALHRRPSFNRFYSLDNEPWVHGSSYPKKKINHHHQEKAGESRDFGTRFSLERRASLERKRSYEDEAQFLETEHLRESLPEGFKVVY